MKRSIEDEIKLKLMTEKGKFGVINTNVIQDTKAANPMLNPVWEHPAEDNPGVVEIVWRLVENILGGKGE